ncbi:hypothetical protein GCM10010166_62200 [Couchioplanes caeruleus subsp. azureus]|nr:hypothetical protein GCM10010166_62200 [Couchioplanes caeruleus subsp. azureus]
MDWMGWPRLWCEFAGDQGESLVILGLLLPGWVRWEPHGDLELASPEPLRAWLSAWT